MKTCSLCKTRVNEEEGQFNEAGKFLCVDCANEGQEDHAFCDECGEIIEDGKCPVCSITEGVKDGDEDDEEDEIEKEKKEDE